MPNSTWRNDRCSTHQDRAQRPVCPVCIRIGIERIIAGKVIDALLAADFIIAIDNGGEVFEVDYTSDRAKLLANLGQTDEEHLYVKRVFSLDKDAGWVRFVYGNDGWDVISDYTTNLETILAPVNAYADSIAP